MGGKAFSDTTFDVDGYLSNRPRYPAHLYTWIRDYLRKYGGEEVGCSNKVLVDVGCGPGFASFPLLDQFETLLGVDTSASMIRSAPLAFQAYIDGGHSELGAKNVSFQVGSSSSMPFIKDESVNCILAATSAHWFDYNPTWREITRITAKSANVIWLTYGEHFLPDHSNLQSIINGFMQKPNVEQEESIGPYFEQPGRGYLNNLLRDLPFPQDSSSGDEELIKKWNTQSIVRKFHPIRDDLPIQGVTQIDLRYYSQTSFKARSEKPHEPFRLEQVMSWKQYEGYIRTSSALHSFLKVYPNDAHNHGGKDIAARFVRKLRGKVLDDRKNNAIGTEEGLDDEHVRVAWPLGLMAISRNPAE